MSQENLPQYGPMSDPLAEATRGLYHWNDPGMDDFEGGWQEFQIGMRVEVRVGENEWLPGTIRETPLEIERGFSVECDWPLHDNMSFLNGRGIAVMTYYRDRRDIWSIMRSIPQNLEQDPNPQP